MADVVTKFIASNDGFSNQSIPATAM